MTKSLALIAALTSALALAGCNSNDRGDRTVGGAVLGGVAGAVVGGAVTGRAGGAVVGGLVGATAGAIVGANTTPRRRCARTAYDEYGNVVCVAYY